MCAAAQSLFCNSIELLIQKCVYIKYFVVFSVWLKISFWIDAVIVWILRFARKYATNWLFFFHFCSYIVQLAWLWNFHEQIFADLLKVSRFGAVQVSTRIIFVISYIFKQKMMKNNVLVFSSMINYLIGPFAISQVKWNSLNSSDS